MPHGVSDRCTMRCRVIVVVFALLAAWAAVGSATMAPHKTVDLEDLEKELEDPALKDIFKSTIAKLRGLNESKDLEEIRRTFRSLVVAVRKRVAGSFKDIREKLFVHPPPKNATAAANLTEDGNSTARQERGRPHVVDHVGAFDGMFRKWIPSVKRDLELTALMMGKLGSDLGASVRELAHEATDELRRIPIKYGRLRSKLTMAFSREKHDDHAELHRARMIQSACGKQYTLEQFVEMFDHDHNLALTEEAHWTNEFKDEWYSGWPVFATHMKLRDPACGSDKWSAVPTKAPEKKEL